MATTATPSSGAAAAALEDDGFVYETLPEYEVEPASAGGDAAAAAGDDDEDDIAALVNSMMKRDPSLLAQAAAAASDAITRAASRQEGGRPPSSSPPDSSSAARADAPAARTEETPPVADDFIRNFFLRHGMQRSLDAFNTEWFELHSRGLLPDDDALAVPDVYGQNERLGTLVTRLRTELGHASEVASRAQSTWDKLRKERDFHRMHHQRVVQEKNRLITDMKRLKTHYEAFAPTIAELKTKYESAMREKALLKVERDRLAARCAALEAQVKAYEESGDAGATLASLPPATGPTGGVMKTTESFMAKSGTLQATAAGGGKRGGAAPRVSPVGAAYKMARMRSTETAAGGAASKLPDDLVNPFAGLAFEPAHAGGYKAQHSFKAHDAAVAALAFHPTKEVVATGSDDLTWRLWSIADGELLMAGEGHRSWLSDIDFHPAGTHIATCAGDGVVKVWDLSTAVCSATFTDHAQTTWALSWHATGDFLVTASMDHSCKMFDVHAGKVKQSFRGHVDSVNAVTWQPFSNTIATGSGDKTVSLWDARSGLCVQTLYGHTNVVHDVSFSLRGDMLASCDADGVVRVWDIRMVMERGSASMGRQPVHAVCFDRSAHVLAAACEDGGVRAIDCSIATEAVSAAASATAPAPGATSSANASTRMPVLCTLMGHGEDGRGGEPAQAVLFDPTSSFLVSVGNDAFVRTWGEHE